MVCFFIMSLLWRVCILISCSVRVLVLLWRAKRSISDSSCFCAVVIILFSRIVVLLGVSFLC